MKPLLAALTCLALLAGCAAPPAPPTPPSRLFIDQAFRPPAKPIDLDEAIALSPAMRSFAEGPMAAEMRHRGQRDGFIEAINSRSQMRLDYDSSRTRTAAEAFDAHTGNCLSMVLMTAALAHHLQVPLRFNSVVLDETWTRSSGMYFVSGHVNVSLARPMATTGRLIFGEPEQLTIDFIPAESLKSQRSRVIDQQTVLAMFANNRAAEALTLGQLDEAYWWSRAAIERDSKWLAGYNTLAVLYRRKGMATEAEAALRHVLDREPLNAQALSNLVLVLSDAGRREEAQRAADQLAALQPVPPYQFFDEGVEAMKLGKFEAARDLFRKEIGRSAYVPEFHFWLGLAQWGMGDPNGTRSSIAKALDNATTSTDRRIYAAKLAWLDDQRSRAEAANRRH